MRSFPIRLGAAQIVIVAFLLALVGASAALGLPVSGLIGDTLLRVAMNGVLVISLIPMLRAGLGMNYGMPLSVLPGLLAMVVALEWRLSGPVGLAVALVLAVVFAIPTGAGYGALLRGVRGNEEVVGTFAGFSAVYLAAIFWGVAPFTNPKMLWPIGGQGLRPQTNLSQWFGHILDRFGAFEIIGIRVPTGTLLAVGLVALAVFIGYRTRWGVITTIAAENPVFARAAGVRLGRLQVSAAMLSTVIAAVGITLYAHTYGFLQLYSAPLMLAYPAAAAILIGGVGADGRVNVSNALFGAFLFNAILVFSTPLANTLLVPELSDVTRVLVTNGVLLYAMIRGTRKVPGAVKA